MATPRKAATAPAKRTPAKRAPAKKAAAPRHRTALDDAPAELRDFYETAKAADTDGDLDFRSDQVVEVDTEKLFSIDGVEYRVPVEFTPHLALVFLDAATDENQWVAIGRLLKSVIGAAGWQALIGFEGLQPEQLQAVLNRVMVKVMGALEGITKN
jgi:hypothetical protein